MDKAKIIHAGKIASEVRDFAKNLIKPGMPLLEIAEEIEQKIKALGGEPAFPVNLSINEIAAHYTPTHDDKTTATGLLKVDIGVQIDGWIADTAFSLDLEGNSENKRLIDVAEKCLKNALGAIKSGCSTNDIGNEIHRTCISNNVNPIVNLSGHEIDRYDLHAGITIPNINDKKDVKLKSGTYAIEPFTTSGGGSVYEGKPSGIYILLDTKNVRSPTAREILTHIVDEYGNLPFCTRWLVREFGTKAILALSQLEQQGNIHHYPQLIESSKAKVAQAEDTVMIEEDQTTITTE
jgi:methionyl aminopeptidase